MSILVRANENNRSIEGFVNYILLRIQRNEHLSIQEKIGLYELYKEYCDMNNINYYHRLTFGKKIKEYGFVGEPYWDANTKTQHRIHTIPEHMIETAMNMIRNVELTSHVGHVVLNGDHYKVTTTFEKVNKTQKPDPSGE